MGAWEPYLPTRLQKLQIIGYFISSVPRESQMNATSMYLYAFICWLTCWHIALSTKNNNYNKNNDKFVDNDRPMYYWCSFDCLSYFVRFFSLYAKPVLKAMFSSYEETGSNLSRGSIFFVFPFSSLSLFFSRFTSFLWCIQPVTY